MKIGFILFVGGLAASLIISILLYGSVTLLSLINLLFLIGGAFLFTALFIMVAQGGFFDGITYSFRRTFQSGGRDLSREEADEMRPFSELLSLPFIPIMLAGASLTGVMLVCLGFFYA
ncbi:DUF3899 domain-containing protein [Metabacillus sp. 84]|uniref:DUF3899 domain-containing protein n=1 Tax=unclassified Metabacillus TaxID=2675274 RepID=UPI003CEC67B8